MPSRRLKGTILALIGLTIMTFSGGTAFAETVDHPALVEHLGLMERAGALPGVSGSVLAGLVNPATWPMQRDGGTYFGWEDVEGDPYPDQDHNDFSSVLSAGNLGFGLRYRSLDEASHYTYTLGLAGGDRSHSTGFSYTWTRGAESSFGAKSQLNLGSVHHWRHVSLGASVAVEFESENNIYQLDLGLRPLGPRFTLFGGASFLDSDDLDDGMGGEYDEMAFSYGLEAKILPGLDIAAMGRDSGEISLRLDFAFGANAAGKPPVRSGFGARFHLDDEQEHAATTYSLESGIGPHLGMLWAKPNQYPELHLQGGLSYRNFRWFDDRRRFIDLLAQIADRAEDPSVGGVVINLSGFGTSPANLWELRAQLAGLRAAGKKVVIYFDRAGSSLFMLASVADELWIDTLGDLDIRGLAFGRTYLAGMLDKVGIGLDEWRFFTYKSALEGLSRTSMSDADREQYLAFMTDWYEEGVSLILEARGVSREDWDELVNGKAYLLPEEALAAGLVDGVGDFHEMRDAAKDADRRETGDRVVAKLDGLFGDRVWGPEEWGEPDRIALLYAIGECSMDAGIQGRRLSKTIRGVRDNSKVKAVVMRADSPGGDPLPSDLVSRELKETMESKPVLISQGQVAASGGYWISMHSHAIHASPFTLTGSIGVISGHFWDKSLGEKIGMDYDQVKIGEHADLDRGPVLPLIGAMLPHRPVTTEERARAEETIRTLYHDFTEEVAEGRGMSVEEVDAVAQGRVWSGTDGLEIGLIDEISGLWGTLHAAKQEAGIPADRRIELLEAPSLGDFNFGMFKPSLLGVSLPWFGGNAAETMPDASDLLAAAPWSSLPTAERLYLEQLINAKGSPLTMMAPIAIEGVELTP
jgi:protease IV